MLKILYKNLFYLTSFFALKNNNENNSEEKVQKTELEKGYKIYEIPIPSLPLYKQLEIKKKVFFL